MSPMYRGCVLNTVAQGFNPSWALYSISNTNSLLLSTFCHYFLSYNNKTMKGHITHTSWCLFSFIHAYWHTHSCPAQWTIYEHKLMYTGLQGQWFKSWLFLQGNFCILSKGHLSIYDVFWTGKTLTVEKNYTGMFSFQTTLFIFFFLYSLQLNSRVF